MLHIVIITGTYYPYFTACSNCANNLAQELKKGAQVTVIAGKNDFSLGKTENYEGLKIIRVNGWLCCFHKWCKDKIKRTDSQAAKLFFWLLLQMKRIFFTVKNLFRLQSIDARQVKNFLRELEHIEQSEKINVVIPVSAPYECIAAAIQFKMRHTDVRVLPFQLDHFAEANSIYKFKIIKKLRYKRHLRLEMQTLRQCTHYFILPQMKAHYSKPFFEEVKNKISVTEHPLFKKNMVPAEKVSHISIKINLVYAGSLDVGLRNPEYFLKVLEHSSIRNTLQANMYTLGNCDAILEKYRKRLGTSLQNHGAVSLKEAFCAMAASDILLSIGNNAPNEVPSKLFDYLSFGKPIVHFYYYDCDAYIEYLRPHPAALCLKIDDSLLAENARRFSAFCSENAGKTISYQNLYKIYYFASPQHIAKQFWQYCTSEGDRIG